MKAARLKGLGHIALEEIPVPGVTLMTNIYSLFDGYEDKALLGNKGANLIKGNEIP